MLSCTELLTVFKLFFSDSNVNTFTCIFMASYMYKIQNNEKLIDLYMYCTELFSPSGFFCPTTHYHLNFP